MRARVPSAVSVTLRVIRLSRRAPPAARVPAPARADATSCAAASRHAGADENNRASARSAKAYENFFNMARMCCCAYVAGAYRLLDLIPPAWTFAAREGAEGTRVRQFLQRLVRRRARAEGFSEIRRALPLLKATGRACERRTLPRAFDA